MKKIYLCGAMGCYKDPNDYMKWRKTINDLFCDEAEIFDPSKYYNYEIKMHKTEKEIMIYDLYNLESSDVVILNLDNVNHSVGSIMEIITAKRLGIPIIAFGDINDVHPWIKECIFRHEDSMKDAVIYLNEYFVHSKTIIIRHFKDDVYIQNFRGDI